MDRMAADHRPQKATYLRLLRITFSRVTQRAPRTAPMVRQGKPPIADQIHLSAYPNRIDGVSGAHVMSQKALQPEDHSRVRWPGSQSSRDARAQFGFWPTKKNAGPAVASTPHRAAALLPTRKALSS